MVATPLLFDDFVEQSEVAVGHCRQGVIVDDEVATWVDEVVFAEGFNPADGFDGRVNVGEIYDETCRR